MRNYCIIYRVIHDYYNKYGSCKHKYVYSNVSIDKKRIGTYPHVYVGIQHMHTDLIWYLLERERYVAGSKNFRPDIQKPRQMEKAVRDI